MSIRAYKIIQIESEKDPTFNYSRDSSIIDKMNIENFNEILEILRDDIEELDVESLTERELEILELIKKDMGEDDYIQYLLY